MLKTLVYDPANGNLTGQIYQVGNLTTDSLFWGRPEDITMARPYYIAEASAMADLGERGASDQCMHVAVPPADCTDPPETQSVLLACLELMDKCMKGCRLCLILLCCRWCHCGSPGFCSHGMAQLRLRLLPKANGSRCEGLRHHTEEDRQVSASQAHCMHLPKANSLLTALHVLTFRCAPISRAHTLEAFQCDCPFEACVRLL